MAKFVTIGERLSVTAPTVNKAFAARDEEPILKRAKQQLDAGAVYLDVNIGPAENDGEDIMKWAVELLQSNFDNVPLALDTSNKKAIEAGISVYNRSKGKPIVNSADAAGRIEYVDLAAANDAIVIALCNGEGIAKQYLSRIFERFFRVDKSGARSEGGSGLGLSIVKHIIEAHDEKIYVNSTFGGGSEFSFTLQKAKKN